MADVFKFNGSYTSTPAGSTSGFPEVSCHFDETVALTKKTVVSMILTSDSPASVPLGGLTNVNVLAVKVIGGHLKLTVTSSDGSAQSVPVDSVYMSISLAVPITAVTVTRDPAVETQVQIFMGERA